MKRREFLALGVGAPAVFAQDAARNPPPAEPRSAEILDEWKSVLGDPPSAETPGYNDSAWKTVRSPHNWED